MLEIEKRSVTPEILSKSMILQCMAREGLGKTSNNKKSYVSDLADETTWVRILADT